MQPLDRPYEPFDLMRREFLRGLTLRMAPMKRSLAAQALTQLFDPGLQAPLHKAADRVRSAEVLIVGPGVDGAFELEWHSDCRELI